MASKLERAQYQYEALLRELGEKAELVGAIDQTDPTLLKNYKRARDSLGDRKLELEFIESEIARYNEQQDQAQEDSEKKIEELKREIKERQDIIDVKRSKANPIRSKLAGAEYDLKFIEKGLEEEKRKSDELKKREDFKKARDHDENVKRMKIDVLKRKKALMDMKRQIKEYEGPAKKLEREVADLEDQKSQIESRLKKSRRSGDEELLQELQRQKEEKQKDVERAELHLKDVLADLGEDLYERRIKHPVLVKFYADLDVVAEAIDKLQG